jgi:pimeloyl-[acyl-carrier protein] methyl ester esterase
MRDRLILLPGWAMGPAALEPLAAALRGLEPHLQVQIAPLPAPGNGDPIAWLDALDANLPPDTWLGGWSLGGMLAAQLARRRGDHCCGLVTLASNLCFVARPDWPWAMPATTFEAFLAGCQEQPAATLKRFGLLCAQGAVEPRALARTLAAGLPECTAQSLAHGLQVLARLDSREALQGFHGPQLHLLAGQDALVPAEVAGELLALLPDVEVGLIEQASHAFVLEDPHSVAAAIRAFLHEREDD